MAYRQILKYPRAALFALYALAGIAVYSRVMLEAGFTFDDYEYVVGNPILFDFNTLINNFSDPRQIGYLSFAINYMIGEMNPMGYHIVNVLIHLANGVLVFFLASNLLSLAGWKREQDAGTVSFLFPASVGLIFLVHPLATQAVSYVTQRFTSMAAFFYLASIVLYLEARKNMTEKAHGSGPMIRYWLALACALLAMKVKEISFTLPAVIAAFELLLISDAAERKRSIYLIIPFIATMVIIPLSILGPDYGIIDKPVGIAETTRVLKVEDLNRSPLEYFATQTRVLIIYLRLLVFPYPQSAIYDFAASKSLFEVKVLLSLAVHLALLAGAVWLWLRSSKEPEHRAPFLKLIAIGIWWFYVTASIESSFIPIKDVIFEHRAYLPGIGIIMAVLSGAMMVIASRPFPERLLRDAVAGIAVVALILGVVAFLRNRVWLNEYDFWDDVVEKMPNKAIGYNNRGNALMHAGRNWEALRDINKTIEFFEKTIGERLDWEEADYTADNMAKTYSNRANVFRALGMTEKADADAKTARMMLSGPVIPLMKVRQSAESAYDTENYRRAIQLYSDILDWFPEDLDAIVGRGNAYSELGSFSQALADLNEAVRRHPESPLGFYNRAIVYKRTGKRQLADVDMQRACSLGLPPACESVKSGK